jgi:hypothetical protein
MKQLATSLDLHDYNSPIKRADGKVPYNGYLWPTESWWPGHENQFRNRVSGSYNFGIIALNDGRYSVEGCVSHIAKNTNNLYPHKDDPPSLPVVFPRRETAIRISAARMIKDIRVWRFHDDRNFICCSDKMSRKTMEQVINWTRSIVAQECGLVKLPTPISIPEPPPPPAPTGLELIDYINNKDHADRLKRR